LTVPTTIYNGTTSIAVSWSGATNVTSYILERGCNGTYAQVYAGTATSYTATAASCTSPISFRVKTVGGVAAIVSAYKTSSSIAYTACNAACTTCTSNTAATCSVCASGYVLSGTTCYAKAVSPTTVTVTSPIYNGTTSVAVSWSGASNVSNYLVEQGCNGTYTTKVSSGTATSYTATAVGCASPMTFRVTAKGAVTAADGTAKVSNSVSYTACNAACTTCTSNAASACSACATNYVLSGTTCYAKATAPTTLDYTNGLLYNGTSVTFTWSGATNVTSYVLERGCNGTYTQIYTGTATSYTGIMGCSAGQTITARIKTKGAVTAVDSGYLEIIKQNYATMGTCNAACTTCTSNAATTCSACASGYVLSGTTCRSTGSVTYSTAGGYTWTAPAYVTQFTVTACGGGGGGGGARLGSGSPQYATSSDGDNTHIAYRRASNPNQFIYVFMLNGGSAGAVGMSNPAAGGAAGGSGGSAGGTGTLTAGNGGNSLGAGGVAPTTANTNGNAGGQCAGGSGGLGVIGGGGGAYFSNNAYTVIDDVAGREYIIHVGAGGAAGGVNPGVGGGKGGDGYVKISW
jgi:hypothetical protein